MHEIVSDYVLIIARVFYATRGLGKNCNFLRFLINERKALSSSVSHTLPGTQAVGGDVGVQ
jgi:hypothetical protein